MLVSFLAFFLCALIQAQVSWTRDECSDSCSSSKASLRTCSCDDECHTYGTCCVDAENIHLLSPSTQEYSCHDERVITPVFAKRTCAKDYSGHDSNLIMCSETDFHRVDERSALLVSSSKTKTTYWNKYCGICNNEDAEDLIPWTAQVVCPEKHEKTKIDQKLIKKNLTFDWDQEDWGLVLGDDFVSCSIVQYQPIETQGKLKYCAPSMIENCPQNSTDSENERLCNAYHAERKLKDTNIYYKNEHCAICNGIPLDDLDCKERTYSPIRLKGLSNTVKAIFSKGDWEKVLGTEMYKCNKDFDFDPFYHKCRKGRKNYSTNMTNAAVLNVVNFHIFLISLVFSIKFIF